jgi:hypothetical protein
MTESSEHKPRIIIDEDWKSQVEAERAAQKAGRSTTDTTRAAGGAELPEQLPPPSFAFLVSTLATQAMATLGQIPDPLEQKPIVRPELSQHYIDTLAMLQEKTKGNLSREESEMLEDVLYQLRMLYVSIAKQPT